MPALRAIPSLACLLVLLGTGSCPAFESTEELLTTIRAVGREGRGNAEARRALAELTAREVAVLPEVLVGFDGASPLAENWLRAAFETIADRSISQGKGLPTKEIEAFVLDRENHARARRLAFEWLRKIDESADERIVPGMLNDPSAEMRRDAVARLIEQAQSAKGTEAIAAYERALSGAVHADQVKAIVEPLRKAGVEIDLPRHFGMLSEWSMIGPFDNREGVGYDAVYPPETEIDLDAEYPAEYPGAKGENTWRKVVTEDDYGLLDIGKQIENHKGSVFYATTTFDSPEARSVEIRLGTPNAWKLWLNGKLVFAREEYHRGKKFDQYRVPVDLVQGENRLLLKVCQNEQTEDWAQDYEFQVRVTDASGTAIRPAGGRQVSVIDREVLSCPVRIVEPHGEVRSTREFVANLAPEGDWRQFRGSDASGVTNADLPTTLSDDSIAWRVDLPGRGVSSPIVIGDRVFVTASSGVDQDRLHVLCLSASSGDLVWERQFWATGRTQTHNSIGVAAPSPASDGRRIFAFYSSNDMACLDLDGNLLWFRGIGHDFPNASNCLGMSSSPVVVGNALVTMVESDAEAFTVGLDLTTGEPRWRLDRPRKANWSSPGILDLDGKPYALVGGSQGVACVDPATGDVLWTTSDGASTIPSSTAADGIVYIPANGLTALDPANLTADGRPEVLWNDGKLGPGTGSPVVTNGTVYVVNRSGVLTAADARTGKEAFRVRLEGNGGASATPIVSNGHLYLIDKAGLLQVVRLDEDGGEVVGTLDLASEIQSTPAAANGALFIRSDEHLWCIGQ